MVCLRAPAVISSSREMSLRTLVPSLALVACVAAFLAIAGPALGSTNDLIGATSAPAADSSAVTEAVVAASTPEIQAPPVPAPQAATPPTPTLPPPATQLPAPSES